MRIIMTNSRLPEERVGDLQAQIAANQVGIKRMQEAYRRYGKALLDSMMELQDYAEQKLKAGSAALPDGVYQFEDFMDDAGIACPDPLPIRVKITVLGEI